MKKTISILLLIALLSGDTALAGFNEGKKEAIEEYELTTMVTDLIIKFYENKDMGYSNDLSKATSPDVLSFLENKSTVHRYVCKLHDIERENYEVSVELLEAFKFGEKIVFRFAVIAKYYYIGADVQTTAGEEIYVMYDRESDLIVDFLAPYDYYDGYVRGYDITFDDFASNKSFSFDSSRESKHYDLINEIDSAVIPEVISYHK